MTPASSFAYTMSMDEEGPNIRRAPREEANVVANKGIYEAVLVASFGGVRHSVSKQKATKVPPWLLMPFCLPVWCAQITAVYALRMEFHAKQSIHESETEGNFSEVLLHVKLLMAAVVALINFPRVSNTVKLLIFVLNPHSWVDIYNHWETQINKGRRFRMGLSVLLSLVALSMSMTVCYIVCIDSLSIILGSEDVKDAIFDGLALHFVQELDEYWWQFVRSVFHLSPLDSFTFEVDDPARTYAEDGDLTPEKEGLFYCPWLVERLLHLTNCGGHHGAPFAEVVVLFLIYQRMLFILAWAVHTDVLPVARDICFQYEFGGYLGLLTEAFQNLLFIRVGTRIQELAVDELDHCKGTTYRSMTMNDQISLAKTYPSICSGGLGMFFLLLVLPRIMQCVWRRTEVAAQVMPSECGDIEQDIGVLHRRQNFTGLRLERVEELLQAMVSGRNAGFGGVSPQPPRGWATP